MEKRRRPWINVVLVIVVVLLAVIPLIIIQNSEFAGADGKAEEAIQEIAPTYQPWFESLVELPGGETETLLFSVQAAIGAGVIGYAIGFYRGRLKGRGEKKT
jgi:cobalt/nickel transport protein